MNILIIYYCQKNIFYKNTLIILFLIDEAETYFVI